MRRVMRAAAEAGSLVFVCVGVGCIALACVFGRVAFTDDNGGVTS